METHSGSSLEFSPNKSLKTSPTSSPATRKGKEKITEVIHEEDLSIGEEMDEGNGASVNWNTCGICLSEDGLAIRGSIDSCDHYFCFVCIMEWAKVESRCPMCKQRFGSIRRPPKFGVFERERVVTVPVRDQVYDPRGNTATGPRDPYAQISCFKCHGSEDEYLLLLCDLCDSAAHTYCVGLGNSVPEGDWYCHDCSIMRNEHSRSQIDEDLCNQEVSDSSRGGLRDAYVSLHEIVQEEAGINGSQVNRISTCPRTECKISLFSQESRGKSSSAANTEPKSSVFSQECQEISSVANTPKQPHARTLRRCRNLHSRIKKLRENWNSLRHGSVTFSSSALESGCLSGNRKLANKVVTAGSSSQSRSFSLTNMETIPDKKNSIECPNSSRDSDDVNRAWKMLKMAQAAQGLCSGAGTHNLMPTKKNIAQKSTFGSSSSQLLRTKQFEDVRSNTTSLDSHRNCSLDLACTTLQRLKCGKQKVDAKLSIEEPILKQSPIGNFLRKGDANLLSEKPILKRSVVGTSFVKGEKRSSVGTSFGERQQFRHPDTFKGSSVPPLVSTATVILPGKPNVSCSPAKPVTTSKSPIEPAEMSGLLDKNFTEVLRKSDGVKSEIQSLVKLNLNLLTKDKQLGVDKFKEVARSATHTILAACGVEHSKSLARPFPSVICRHTGQPPQIRLSNIMPNSCRECFYLFVKEVVNSLMVMKQDPVMWRI
ncbi:hypothetical protein H6P81_008576 [Aristolochia fimbriata]|uniref:PHD and RING finger domain-containing protein 1 n=1 Tax=Aristolochia fimbriata TaxID=158543 RepID=A0AAV7EJQ1_ARIFI|nr:hypothetical protein H6P81_008576 [Aristolochia fimbriata]